MNANVAVPIAFFIAVTVIAIVVPIVRAIVRRSEREGTQTGLSPELGMRLDRMEAMIETVAVEVERLAEGQRFTTRLLSEGAAQPLVQASRAAVQARGTNTEVTNA